jgi:hypothetical protein
MSGAWRAACRRAHTKRPRATDSEPLNRTFPQPPPGRSKSARHQPDPRPNTPNRARIAREHETRPPKSARSEPETREIGPPQPYPGATQDRPGRKSADSEPPRPGRPRRWSPSTALRHRPPSPGHSEPDPPRPQAGSPARTGESPPIQPIPRSRHGSRRRALRTQAAPVTKGHRARRRVHHASAPPDNRP